MSVAIKCTDGDVTISNVKFERMGRFSPPIADVIAAAMENDEVVTEYNLVPSGCTIEQWNFIFKVCKTHWDDPKVTWSKGEMNTMKEIFRKNFMHHDERDVEFLYDYFGPEGVKIEHAPFLIATLLVADFQNVQIVARLINAAIALLIRDVTRRYPITEEGCSAIHPVVRMILGITEDDCTDEQRAQSREVITWCKENYYGQDTTTAPDDPEKPNKTRIVVIPPEQRRAAAEAARKARLEAAAAASAGGAGAGAGAAAAGSSS